MTDIILQGDALTVLKTLPDKSVNCCVTSPPYYGLRNYNTKGTIWDGDEKCQHNFTKEVKKGTTGGVCVLDGAGKAMTEARYTPDSKHGFCIKCGAWQGELGLEPTPELYVKHIVDIFREVRRALKDDGTLFLNLGDSYWGSGKGSGQDEFTKNLGRKTLDYGGQVKNQSLYKHETIKPKDLIGIPWMVAFALRADGWYLRQDIIWSKPNPMPESVTDRCTKAHEYIFLLSKSQKYYYDAEAIKTESLDPDDDRGSRRNRKRFPTDKVNGIRNSGLYPLANKRSVWEVNTMPYSEAHFATFPEKLIVDMIKAGCPEGGVVIDPFIGAGTTGLVAKKLGRHYIGIELNPAYIKIAENRIFNEIGLFA